MHSKKRILGTLAAVVIGAPVAVVVGFFVWLYLDMHRVEARADECSTLIPAILEFKSRIGRLPNVAEANQIDVKLRTRCDYYNSGQQFSMGLTGGWINMQVYGYSSETNRWYWD